MHITHAMPHLHCDTHVMHFYFVFCLCIVALVSLFRLVGSVLCRCTQIVCASDYKQGFFDVYCLLSWCAIPFGLLPRFSWVVCLTSCTQCICMHFHALSCNYQYKSWISCSHASALYSPRVYNSRIISLTVIVVEFVSRVIYFYAFEFTADIALWVKNLTYKPTMRFVGCIAFGLVCAFGMGLPLLFVFIYIPASFKLLNDIIYILGGGGEQQGGVATILSKYYSK